MSGLTKLRRYQLILLIISLLTVVKMWESHHYRALIPSKVKTQIFPKEINTDSLIFGGCGTVLFRLSDKQVKMIENEGINFFTGATQAYFFNKKIYYEPWKITPRTNDNEGGLVGLACSGGLKNKTAEAIRKAATSSGSYYTRWGVNRELYVIPPLKLVAYVYFD